MSEIEGTGRVETENDDPDLSALDRLMIERENPRELQADSKMSQKQAIGTSMNIFDESYNSMPFKAPITSHQKMASKDFLGMNEVSLV